MSKDVDAYANDIKSAFQTGHAKEHGYRPALERLMNAVKDVKAINDPKRSEHGNPDFIFLKSSNTSIILGYAEAKDVDVELNKVEKTNQMERYGGYDNLFLTNYLEFRFYKNGEKYQTISIGEIKDGDLRLDANNFDRLFNELTAFIEQPPETIKSGLRLATIMGAKARRLRDNVELFFSEEATKNDELEKIYVLMKELLVHDLSHDKFADMYAQTLMYGLFVARYYDNSPESFSRTEARDLVPASNPFLREFFDHIVGPRFDKRLAYIVDELSEIFSVSDVQGIVHKHLKVTDEVKDEKDPIIHFYEDFLNAYDPAERKKMGAYYTPVPVVRYMVNEVDRILKEEFELSKGIADTSRRKVSVTAQGRKVPVEMHNVQILDPAVGTATFLNEIIKHLFKTFSGQEGRWPTYVKQDLLPRLYGFELMMAPYTIAHLKLGMTLKETGLDDFSERLGVYLTNTLEEGIKRQPDLFSIGLAEVVSEESESAAVIKSERPIMIVIGNPPYSGESSNKTEYANSLVKKYKVEPGGVQKLQERNPKWLNDDYVKFIAFAEDMINKNGHGILAMITNHSYLDNPTFRGMRWHLTKSFDKLFVLDLHGNYKKLEKAPDGSKDQNVFDIQQGVSIILGIKKGNKKSCEVLLADLYGTRQDKFDALDENKIQWNSIALDPQTYLFKKTDSEGKKEYDKGIGVDEIFIKSSAGVVTGADKILIANTKDELVQNLRSATNSTQSSKVAKRLSSSFVDEDYIKLIDYRPFDTRFIYYDHTIVERGRWEVVKHFVDHDNFGLMMCRQQKTDGFFHVLIHKNMAESSYVSNRTSEIGSSFPLYLYHQDGTKSENFSMGGLKKLTAKLSIEYQPMEIMDYIYGVLHSPSYREKYKKHLKSGLPKIPVPNDKDFKNLALLGEKLRNAHLVFGDTQTTYPVVGEDTVDRVEFKDNKVWINSTQYFGNVPSETWLLQIGAYLPAYKWLNDRKGHKLSGDEIEHYLGIIGSLTETDRLVKEVDKVWQP